jgi:hypothetical protein
MSNELITLEQASTVIDRIVLECVPLAGMQMTTFSDTLKLAEGIKTLRQIFQTPGVKATVEAMQDTKLGFLTDRDAKAIARAKRDLKELRPYTYAEVAECCIEGMLKGYRITNNEFNIISSGFYAAKNGKYRKIVEHPDIAEFDYTTTSPAYEPDGKWAKVKCFASWRQKGKRRSVGLSDQAKGKEDTLIFRIRVNAMMGEDAIIGKALSKLFGRVLSRIDGRVLPESTDLEFGEGEVIEGQIVNGSSSTDDLTAKIQAQGKEAAPGPEAPQEIPTSPKRGGRPAGSKNKPREPEPQVDPPEVAPAEEGPQPQDEPISAEEATWLLDAQGYKDALTKENWAKILTLFGQRGKDFPALKLAEERAKFLEMCQSNLDRQNG